MNVAMILGHTPPGTNAIMIKLFLIAATALLPLSAAQATLSLSSPMVISNNVVVQTITQNLTFTPELFGTGLNSETLTFAQFNTNNGFRTLTGVTINWTSSFANNITATSGSGNTRTLQTTASFLSSISTVGNLFSFSNTVSGTSPQYTLAGQGTSATFGVSGSATGSFTAVNLASFIGPGSIGVTSNLSNIVGTITSIEGGKGNQTLTGGEGISALSINYVYEVLPEPGTWAMLIIGFGFVGASMRRRRTIGPIPA